MLEVLMALYIANGFHSAVFVSRAALAESKADGKDADVCHIGGLSIVTLVLWPSILVAQYGLDCIGDLNQRKEEPKQ